MNLKEKISAFKHKRDRRRKERNQERYNRHQEEYDARYRNEKQKNDFKTLIFRLKFQINIKRLVGLIIFIGLLDLQLSYVLAFLGKEQIAESLSIQICTTLLGTILVYAVREYFDMREEKRTNNKSNSDENIKEKIDNVINSSGLKEHINSVLQTENPDDSE